MIIYIFFIVGLSLLISLKVKTLPMMGFGISPIISSSAYLAFYYTDLFLSTIGAIHFYITIICLHIVVVFITIFIIFLVYIFFKKEINDCIEGPKLSTNLIPKPCWGQNCRENEPYKSKWPEISRFILSRTKKCKICGVAKSKDSNFECHEEWSFNNTQKLEEVMAICQKCHHVKHIGRTKKLGDIPFLEAKKHMQFVNGWSSNRVSHYINNSFEEVRKLNKIKVSELNTKWLDNFLRKNKKAIFINKRSSRIKTKRS